MCIYNCIYILFQVLFPYRLLQNIRYITLCLNYIKKNQVSSTLILRILLGLVQVVVRYSVFSLWSPCFLQGVEAVSWLCDWPCEHFLANRIWQQWRYCSSETRTQEASPLWRLLLPMLSCWWRWAHTKWDESFNSGPPGPASWPQMETRAWPLGSAKPSPGQQEGPVHSHNYRLTVAHCFKSLCSG